MEQKQKAKVLHAVMVLLPKRVTSQPQNGIAITEPAAVPRSARPRLPLVRWSSVWMAGMRETQVATTRPWMRNMTTEDHQIRKGAKPAV